MRLSRRKYIPTYTVPILPKDKWDEYGETVDWNAVYTRLEPWEQLYDVLTALDGRIDDANLGKILSLQARKVTDEDEDTYLEFDDGTDPDTIKLYTGGTNSWTVNSSGHWYPVTDSTYDIGINSTNYVRGIYCDVLYTDTAGSKDGFTRIDFDGTSDEMRFDIGPGGNLALTINSSLKASFTGEVSIAADKASSWHRIIAQGSGTTVEGTTANMTSTTIDTEYMDAQGAIVKQYIYFEGSGNNDTMDIAVKFAGQEVASFTALATNNSVYSLDITVVVSTTGTTGSFSSSVILLNNDTPALTAAAERNTSINMATDQSLVVEAAVNNASDVCTPYGYQVWAGNTP